MDVTHSSERVAREVRFGPEDVERMRRDVLLLMKNVDRTEGYEDARKFYEGVKTWADGYRRDVYDFLLPNVTYAVREHVTGSRKWTDNPYFNEQIDRWAKYWEKELRPPTWNLYLALREMPMESTHMLEKYQQASPDSAKSVIFERWTRDKKKWSDRVKREARGAWKALTTFLGWLKTKNVEMTKTEREVTQQRMEGFAVRIIGFEPDQEWDQAALTKFEEGLRLYRQRASQVLPILLKGQLPIEFHLHCKIDEGGRYERDHIMVCSVLGDPKTYTHVIAHEMGHHLWRTYVSSEMQRFWSDAIHGDYKDLDLHSVLDAWKPGESYYALIHRLQREDPILSLQLESLTADYGNKTFDLREREDLVAYLNGGGRARVSVPTNPITEYANKNDEEAFCEVVGYLVAYGPRAVTPQVRQWLHTIMPGYYREASVGSMLERVVTRYLVAVTRSDPHRD